MKVQCGLFDYLEANKSERKLTAEEARNIIKQRREHSNLIGSEEFLIGDEVMIDGASKTRYFQIFYFEGRTDQLFVQLTPMHCFRICWDRIIKYKGEVTLLRIKPLGLQPIQMTKPIENYNHLANRSHLGLHL